MILQTEDNVNTGELETVDFQESTEILDQDEQLARWEWELSKGIIDIADILMQKDPDKFPDRETAQDYLFDRKEEEDPTAETSPLLEALTTPTE